MFNSPLIGLFKETLEEKMWLLINPVSFTTRFGPLMSSCEATAMLSLCKTFAKSTMQ